MIIKTNALRKFTDVITFLIIQTFNPINNWLEKTKTVLFKYMSALVLLLKKWFDLEKKSPGTPVEQSVHVTNGSKVS